MFFRKKEFDPTLLSEAMTETIVSIFQKMTSERFSRPPVARRRPIIIENEDRMMASGFYKNFGRSYIASINYYLTEGHAKKHKPCGTVIVYVSQIIAEKLFKAMNLLTKPKVTDEDLADLCGEVCNIFAGDFKNKLSALGYRSLTLSPPEKFLDKAP